MSAPVQQNAEDAGITDYQVTTGDGLREGFELLRHDGKWKTITGIRKESKGRFIVTTFDDGTNGIYESHWWLKVRTPDRADGFGEPADTMVRS